MMKLHLRKQKLVNGILYKLCECEKCNKYFVAGKTTKGKEKQFILGHNRPWNEGLTKETDERVKRNAENNREPHLGNAGYWTGKSRDKETNKVISEKLLKLWEDPEYRDVMIKAANDRMTDEVRVKCGNGRRGKTNTLESNAQRSVTMKSFMASLSDDDRSAWMNRRLSGNEARPNKPETIILNLLNNMYPNEWKYTGDGSFWINGKNPDFVNCNGQKKCVEMFGDYWHKGEDPQDRIDTFTPFGFDTLVIWEKELKNIEDVKIRIKDFAEASHVG